MDDQKQRSQGEILAIPVEKTWANTGKSSMKSRRAGLLEE
jgi:hypothetical protein